MDYNGFERGKITVFESSAGAGAVRLALDSLNIDYQIIGTSETNFESIMMYDALHNNNEYSSDLSEEEMLDWIESKNVGDAVFAFSSNGKYGIKKFYEANIRNKNYGDIALINPNDLENFDMMTYKFHPKFIPETVDDKFVHYIGEKSSVVTGCSNIIEAKKPKYLLFETDDCTISAKYEQKFTQWLLFLESLGYKSYTKHIRYKEFDTPQNKIRTFVFSVLGEHNFRMPDGENTNLRLRNFLEKNVSRKFFLKKEFEFFEGLDSDECEPVIVARLTDKKKYYNIANIVSVNGISTAIQSSIGGGKVPKVLVKKPSQMNVFSVDGMTVREITPLEAWLLSGYTKEDYNKISKVVKSKTVLYILAGKSSNPKILKAILKQLFKEGIDNESKEIN